MSQEPSQPGEEQVLQSVLAVWGQRDASAAFSELESQGPPEVAAARYGALAQQLYNQHKDVPKMILTARAGIQYALEQARRIEAADPQKAAALQGRAKMIAYNLGANCWPGWRDEGVAITPTDLAVGLDAARLNMRLAVELERPAEPLAHAHWLLGAHLMAGRQFEPAVAEFTQAADKFEEAGKADARLMARGYAALARKLERPNETAAADSLQSTIQSLLALDADDARFYAQQLQTADEVFAK